MAYPPHSPTGNAFAIRFSEMAKPVANAPHSPECRYTEWRYAKCHSNECRCTERRYAKCRSTICHFVSVKWQSLWRMHRIRQSVVIQSVVLPNIVVPSGVMLNVIVSFAILLQRNGKATVPLAHWFELGDFLLNTKKKSRRVQTTRLKRQSKIMSLLAAMSRIIKISRVWVK
jgi:hypothetical protein